MLAASPSTSTEDKQLHGALAGTGPSSREALLGLLGGMIFGLVSPLVGHPFDTVKTKMQAAPAYKNLNAFQTVSRILRKDGGVAGLYRGLLPPLIGSVAYRGILFSAYSGTYAACSDLPEIPHTFGLKPGVLLGAVAAATTRATIETPLEFLKVRAQVGTSSFAEYGKSSAPTQFSLGNLRQQFHSTVRLMSTQPMHRHVQHLYQGYSVTLLRTLGLLGPFFVFVDYSTRFIPHVVNAPLIGPFFQGGICATAAWVFAFPMETVKSRVQAGICQGGTWATFRFIVQHDGFRGLYRGFGPGASRSLFANGASMTVYAWFQKTMREP